MRKKEYKAITYGLRYKDYEHILNRLELYNKEMEEMQKNNKKTTKNENDML